MGFDTPCDARSSMLDPQATSLTPIPHTPTPHENLNPTLYFTNLCTPQ